MIVGEAKLRRSDLPVAWMDYQKAYDRVPHGWLEQLLRITEAPENARQCTVL